ncbi:UDP-GlcNAc--UDP-phosphate GlcNAc-1-phosphate transferase [Polaribacter sp.]|uniref:UDP-GlcNAc--UDP-phosphate GlcNAc-1-phosphate transferase n=1 Tax=Polaribacter sp. TaxID=1920175 RepID=UPI00404758AE
MENYLLTFVTLCLASYAYLKLAIKFNIIDKPNERSSHTKPTVRGGGIVFVVALVLFFLMNKYQYSYFILGTVALAIISFLDDIYTLSSKIRYPLQLVAVVLLLWELGVPFSPLYSTLFLVVLGTAMVNMFNFMDGINGITGLYSLASLAGIWMINEQVHLFDANIIYYTAIALVVFGFYNFRKKALFFAGDIGSITMGLLMYFLVIGLALHLKAPLLFLVAFVYGADASFTLLYRKFFTNESIFAPHRHHIYQKLVRIKKIPHLTVSAIYAAIQLVLNGVLYVTYQLPLFTQLFILLGFIFVFLAIYIVLFKKLEEVSSN